MDIKIILGVLAAVIGTLAFFPYIRDTLTKKTKPHSFTWLIWALTQGTAVVALWVGGGGVGAIALTIGTFLVFCVFLLSLKYGTKDITRSDKMVLIVALLAIVVWWQLDNPVLAVIMVSAIDVLGFIPSFRKSFKDPWSETTWSWIMYATANILAIFALREYNALTVTYISSIAVAEIFLLVIVYFRRPVISSKLTNHRL
ncbi:MAG: hypothetical protein ABIH67_01280 [Candidatus Uhrbacteria bacterium]